MLFKLAKGITKVIKKDQSKREGRLVSPLRQAKTSWDTFALCSRDCYDKNTRPHDKLLIRIDSSTP